MTVNWHMAAGTDGLTLARDSNLSICNWPILIQKTLAKTCSSVTLKLLPRQFLASPKFLVLKRAHALKFHLEQFSWKFPSTKSSPEFRAEFAKVVIVPLLSLTTESQKQSDSMSAIVYKRRVHNYAFFDR